MGCYIGIDMAKATFDVAMPGPSSRIKHHHLTNDEQGFERLLALLPEEAICVMEATGPYYQKLVDYLHTRGIAVSVCNPLSVNRFAQITLARAKTDRVDAALIMRYGKKFEPPLYVKRSQEAEALHQQQTVLRQLKKQQTQIKNSLEALLAYPKPSQEALSALEATLKGLEEAMANLKKSLVVTVDTAFPDMRKRLNTIVGIGDSIAIELITITDGFTRFESAKKFVCYIGTTPRVYESGTSVKGKPRITKMGMSGIRSKLYMGAQASLHSNIPCRDLYDRLKAKGKSGKQALMAVANKLVRQAFAIATNETEFNPNYLKKTELAT